jgi:hypothetical protein
MRKRQSKKLLLATETLRHLDPPEARKAVGGRQEYQCPPTVDESSGGFSNGAGPGYCYTVSGDSACA